MRRHCDFHQFICFDVNGRVDRRQKSGSILSPYTPSEIPDADVSNCLHRFYRAPIRYSFDAVRRITLPPATAGVASDISFSEFLPSSLNSGPA